MMTGPRSHALSISHRRFADLLLFAVTSTELTILFIWTGPFRIEDWIYVLQHLLVLAIALKRPPPKVQDRSLASAAAVLIAYAYPYAQVIYLDRVPGDPGWPGLGLALIIFAAVLSLISLFTLGKQFGVRPALRDLVTKGPYSIVRHPIYLSYVIGDVGYNLQEWNIGTVLMVLIGWLSLIYRINAEERTLSADPRWHAYAAAVPNRLIPGLW